MAAWQLVAQTKEADGQQQYRAQAIPDAGGEKGRNYLNDEPDGEIRPSPQQVDRTEGKHAPVEHGRFLHEFEGMHAISLVRQHDPRKKGVRGNQ